MNNFLLDFYKVLEFYCFAIFIVSFMLIYKLSNKKNIVQNIL